MVYSHQAIHRRPIKEGRVIETWRFQLQSVSDHLIELHEWMYNVHCIVIQTKSDEMMLKQF